MPNDDLIYRLKCVPAYAFLRIPTGAPLISAEILVGELCHEAADALLRQHFNAPEGKGDEATMPYLLQIIGLACVKNHGTMTWEEGLQAIRKSCVITCKQQGAHVYASDHLADAGKVIGENVPPIPQKKR